MTSPFDWKDTFLNVLFCIAILLAIMVLAPVFAIFGIKWMAYLDKIIQFPR